MTYFQRESHELVNLDSCELIRSQFDLVTDYQASIALDFFAEASELLLPSASTAVLLAVIGRCGVPPRAPRLAAGPQPGFGNE
jgi:hypothetical protein